VLDHHPIHTMRSLLLLICFFILCGCGGDTNNARVRPPAWAQPVIGTPLKNLHCVTPYIYRSSQPSAKELQQTYEQLGIRSVLSLREYHHDKDEAVGLPLQLYRVKMNAGHVDSVAVKQALTIIKTAPKPILIHCWHGADRTGLVIAAWRIAEQHWSVDDAIDELKNGDYGYHESVFPGVIEWLRSDGVSRISQ
jgi:protein tyrosine phosphatase (PTP) superfamily phosphohydrolase (DUF442 family)